MTASTPTAEHALRFWSTSHLLRYLPAVVAVLACLGLLARYDTPATVTLLYVLYGIVAVALPGTLLWRRVRGPATSFVEDVAVGTAVGLAIQVLLAYALAPLGVSRFSWVWAVLVLAWFLLVPAERARSWTRPGPRGTSVASAWVQSAAVAASALWLSATSLARDPVVAVDGTGPWVRAVPVTAYVDLPFHQSIAAGIDRTFPLVYPYLYDEPLNYHLFAYEHLAGVTRATGIDLTWVLFRLDPIALVALAVVLVGVLARRLSGRSLAAPVAAVVVTLSSAVSVYGWSATPFQSPGLLQFATYRSPTHTFGMPLFLAMLVVATPLLRGRLTRRGLPLLVVLTVLAFATAGSKATFLPVLVCGLLLAGVVQLVLRQRDRALAVLAVGAVTCAALAFSTLVILGGQSGSLLIDPLRLTSSFAIVPASGATFPEHAALLTAIALWAWLSAGIGVLLLLRRRQLTDSAFWMVVGSVVAGTAAALLTAANGLSQLYFLYACWPLLGILTAWGLVEASARLGRPAAVVLLGALPVGAVLAWGVTHLNGTDQPTHVPGGFPYRAILGPWLVLLVLATLVALGVGLLAGRSRTRGAAAALGAATLVALIAGGSLTVRAHDVAAAAKQVATDAPVESEGWVVPRGGALAALALRDQAGTDDVVATNAHCYGPPDNCDSRHFWVSALTERRTVVEGWAYPEGFHEGQTRTSPFWDQARYLENEAVFTSPSADAVDALVRDYGVRWLFVDRTIARESPDLARYADLVLENDDAAVYRVG